MWGSIKYNLRHLTDFTGRDARQTFWYYVLFLYLLNTALLMVAMVPLMALTFGRLFTATQGDPEAVKQVMPDLMGNFLTSFMWLTIATVVLYILLLSAAFARRLHDSDLPGWWGLPLLALYLASLAQMPARIDAMKGFVAIGPDENPIPHMQAFQQQIGFGSLLGWVPIILLVILGVRKSTSGPNRYGEAPVRF